VAQTERTHDLDLARRRALVEETKQATQTLNTRGTPSFGWRDESTALSPCST
jgi:hypothetical protein